MKKGNKIIIGIAVVSIVMFLVFAGVFKPLFWFSDLNMGYAIPPETPYSHLVDRANNWWCDYFSSFGELCANFESINLHISGNRAPRNHHYIPFGWACWRTRFNDQHCRNTEFWLEDASEFGISSINLHVECDDGSLNIIDSMMITDPLDSRVEMGVESPNVAMGQYGRGGWLYFDIDTSDLDGPYCVASGSITIAKGILPPPPPPSPLQFLADIWNGFITWLFSLFGL